MPIQLYTDKNPNKPPEYLAAIHGPTGLQLSKGRKSLHAHETWPLNGSAS